MISVLVVALCLGIAGGAFAQAKAVSIGIFIPGVVAGSPLYEQLVNGAQKVGSENANVTIKVVEGGFNQADWGEKVMSMVASQEYTYILTSNTSMPDVSLDAAKAFPNQKFIMLDAFSKGNPQYYTALYNQVEQGYFWGYMGGLVTTSKMKGANPDLKVGMIVAQEYPALLKEMKAGYEMGLKAVNPKITVDYRVIGNWYDANKAADLANSMIDSGVDVILAIAGGANQGVIKAAQERGKYVLYPDSNEFKLGPGTIVGCAILNQERLVYETLKKALAGTLAFGTADIVNAKGGYVDFVEDDPLYINNVPADVRSKMSAVVKQVKSGQIKLDVPPL
jgi:simple sugar transport system substrate-binding protein